MRGYMARYLNPRADVVFRKIFGEHKHLLISFLNSLLPLPSNGLITSLSYLQPEQSPKIPVLKRTIKTWDIMASIYVRN
jgi:hypothetical protein